MITKLTEIKGFGIFENYKQGAEASPFLKYNLVYGWNGSGKTTLGKLFRAIENKVNEAFPKATFRVETDTAVIDNTFASEPPIVRVFNKDFVVANTNLDKGRTNSLLYLGKENKELQERIKELDTLISGTDGKTGKTGGLNAEKGVFEKLEKKRDEFYKNTGADLKRVSLTTIFPNPNADKATAESIWQELQKGQSLNDFLLEDEEYKIKSAFIAQGQKKNKITASLSRREQVECERHFREVNNLLSENPVIKSVARLKEKPDIASWVQQGLAIHEKHNSNKCEYCGNEVKAERVAELSEHFNYTFIQFQKNITDKIEELKLFKVKEVEIAEGEWFGDVRVNALEQLQIIRDRGITINEQIQDWISKLEQKFNNPLNSSFPLSNIGPAETISPYNYAIDELEFCIKRHNSLLEAFDKTAKQYNKEIENHIVASRAISESHKQTLVDIEVSGNKLKDLKNETNDLKKEKDEKSAQLLSDNIALAELNSDLRKFLGKGDFLLEKNTATNEGGYIIKRNGVIAENLSEGEKTAIALVYFIAKLGEKGNDIKKNILVFDDPISSFDSNHLFSACTYITNKCESAEQLFFLTHNFWFFKLIRDWIERKNAKCRKAVKPLVGNFYSIKKGILYNAESTLVNYHSEYHFIFDGLLKLRGAASIDLNEAYSIANYCRRLLESFNSFKTQETSGFNGVLQMANGLEIDKADTDKVYFYVNKYSHLDRVESFENTVENIEAEGQAVIDIAFRIIEKVDNVHYKSMLKACARN